MKGGYKIIDFKNVSLSGTPVTMTDVLVDLLNNYDKVVLLSHVVLSGSAKDDCYSTVLSDGAGGVKLNCYDGYISINSSGAVTYTVASASGMAGDIAELTAEIGDLDNLETTDKGSIVGAINEVKNDLHLDNTPITLENVHNYTAQLPVGFSKTVLLSKDIMREQFGVNHTAVALAAKATDNLTTFFGFISASLIIFTVIYDNSSDTWASRKTVTMTNYTPS